jgi:hypothetical protein
VAAGAQLIRYAPAPGAQPSPFFQGQVNDLPVFVEQYNRLSYLYVSFAGPLTIVIDAVDLTGYRLSPLRTAPPVVIEAGRLRFSLRQPQTLVLHRPGDEDSPRLIIFADPLEEDVPDPGQPGVVHLTTAYDVDASGGRLETATLQRALDETARAGAILFIPPGVYRTRELFVPSRAHIYLAGGAVLRATDGPEDDNPSYGYGLLRFENVSDITLRGRGMIDGGGSTWRGRGGWFGILYGNNAHQVHIEGLILRDSTTFNVWIERSSDWLIERVKIMADAGYVNTDGFDFISAQRIRVQDVFYLGTDDFTSHGSSEQQPDNNAAIVVQRAVIYTGGSFKIGTTAWQETIHDLRYEQIDIIYAEDVFGLYLVTGADYEDICFTDIFIEDLLDTPPGPRGWASSTLFTLRIEVADWEPGSAPARLGHIRRVHFRNIISAEPGKGQSVIIAYDDGRYRYAIEDIVFENVQVAGETLRSAAPFAIPLPAAVTLRFEPSAGDACQRP